MEEERDPTHAPSITPPGPPIEIKKFDISTSKDYLYKVKCLDQKEIIMRVIYVFECLFRTHFHTSHPTSTDPPRLHLHLRCRLVVKECVDLLKGDLAKLPEMCLLGRAWWTHLLLFVSTRSPVWSRSDSLNNKIK